MKEMKIFIKNRNGKKIALIVEIPEKPRGLAFIMHGLGGYKEEKHIAVYAEAFKENDFIAVRFDACNTYGESEGSYEDANITNYYSDLEDVIKWAEKQPWYQAPFCLAGHSLGGISITLYAENHPEKVKALAPTSTVISGKLNLEREPKQLVGKWNKTGWKISPSKSKPGIMKKLRWHQFVEDSMKYDILPKTSNLAMPVLLLVGDKDKGTPLRDQKTLYNKLKNAELHIIKDAPHTFIEPKHLSEIKSIFTSWIKKVENKQKV